jgi:hypothetical protein
MFGKPRIHDFLSAGLHIPDLSIGMRWVLRCMSGPRGHVLYSGFLRQLYLKFGPCLAKLKSQDKALKSRLHRISLYWFGAESRQAAEGLRQVCIIHYADLGLCCATHRTIPCTPFSSSGFACGIKGPVIGWITMTRVPLGEVNLTEKANY